MSDQTEEKSLPPSEHKLRKAREKGQVASSADFVSMLSVTGGIIFLLFTWQQIFDLFDRVLQSAVQAMQAPTQTVLFGLSLELVFSVGWLLAPLAALLIIIGIVANILHKQGIPFSLHPIKPDFKKINPGEGFKKLFSRRNATEIGQSFVRLMIWFGICAVFLWLTLKTLFQSMYCSLGCVVDASSDTGILIIIAAVVMLVAAALADLPIQISLFRHEQKMGHKEAKREIKDVMGSPEFKAHRQEEYRKMVNSGSGRSRSSKGVQGAGGGSGGGSGAGGAAGGNTIKGAIGSVSMILRGGDTAVGLYYHPEHASVPEVVLRVRGGQMQARVQEAQKIGVPVVTDNELATDIYRSIDLGSVLRERHFEKTARKMIETGVIVV